jgi:hypothetical protein
MPRFVLNIQPRAGSGRSSKSRAALGIAEAATVEASINVEMLTSGGPGVAEPPD